jgi:hypothetical protein
MKIARDFVELPEDAHEGLRQSLFQHIYTYEMIAKLNAAPFPLFFSSVENLQTQITLFE